MNAVYAVYVLWPLGGPQTTAMSKIFPPSPDEFSLACGWYQPHCKNTPETKKPNIYPRIVLKSLFRFLTGHDFYSPDLSTNPLSQNGLLLTVLIRFPTTVSQTFTVKMNYSVSLYSKGIKFLKIVN